MKTNLLSNLKRVIILTLANLLIIISLVAQSPQRMSYQAVVRDAANELVTNSTVGMQISILQGSITGTSVFVEAHGPTTNINGLVSIEIGNGSVISGNFSTIDWSNGPYFIKTKTDPTGGSSYTITGTSQLLSVPYALYAKTAGNAGANGTTGPTGPAGNDGATGPSGLPGVTGPTGEAGPQGTTGNDGADGNDGATGATGAQGADGNDGVSGSTGPTGPAGVDGTILPPGGTAGQVLSTDGAGNYSWVDNTETVTDIDGNEYGMRLIGQQMWMTENLKTTRYQNGDAIPNVTDGTAWSNLTTGAWSNYDNNSNYDVTYGKLYNWYTVSDARNVCPTGWHVPTDAEWFVLTGYLCGVSVAGGKMKEAGLVHWGSPNGGATNQSGFSGLPGGYRGADGYFNLIVYYGYWWSSSEFYTDDAWRWSLIYGDSGLGRNYVNKDYGLSVRCLRD